MQSRREKLDWAKQRALECLDSGMSQAQAMQSFANDIQKQGLWDEGMEATLRIFLLRVVFSMEDEEFRSFIDGFD